MLSLSTEMENRDGVKVAAEAQDEDQSGVLSVSGMNLRSDGSI